MHHLEKYFQFIYIVCNENTCFIFKKGTCSVDWCLCENFDAKRFMKNFRQTWQEIKKGWKSGSPDCDVEDVASDRGGDCHVTEALPGDDDGGDQVGDGGARGEEGQPHHLQTLVSFCINTHGDNSYPWLATIILLLKRLDMTWCVLLRAVETNWEISSQSLAIRYTTGFKPFYFHGKDRITIFISYHHLKNLRGNSNGVARNGGPPDHQVGVERDPDDRSKESDGEELSRCKKENVRSRNSKSVNMCVL